MKEPRINDENWVHQLQFYLHASNGIGLQAAVVSGFHCINKCAQWSQVGLKIVNDLSLWAFLEYCLSLNVLDITRMVIAISFLSIVWA